MKGSVLVVTLFLLSSACTMTPQITNYTAPGSLEARTAIDCGKPKELNNKLTPPDLYGGMVRCIEQERFEDGVLLLSLAGTYSYFDHRRVADVTAHQAHSVLPQEALGSVDDNSRQAFWEVLQNTLGNQLRLPAICDEVKRIGPPDYYPRYMIQHGMEALLGSSGNGLIGDFDSDAAWKEALDSYLHCPGI